MCWYNEGFVKDSVGGGAIGFDGLVIAQLGHLFVNCFQEKERPALCFSLALSRVNPFFRGDELCGEKLDCFVKGMLHSKLQFVFFLK